MDISCGLCFNIEAIPPSPRYHDFLPTRQCCSSYPSLCLPIAKWLLRIPVSVFRLLSITLAAVDTFEYQTARSLCDEYTSKSRRPNGQHCYVYTNTVLVCGVENRRDGLYQMNTKSNSDSWFAIEGTDTQGITGSPEETQCSSILAYLDRQDDLREMYVGQQEL